MAVFALVHAAAVNSWYWHPLTAELRDRLHLEPDVMPGDHCPMLGHPTELADRLVAYHRSLGTTAPGAGTPN